jgi:nucleotide-binding universal stress UspA family protein
VLLATLGVPFAAAAVEQAIAAALESGRPLLVVNVVELPPLGMCVNMRYQLDDPPELATALAEPAVLARSLGIEVERLRVRSMRPLDALFEVVAEHVPGFLVFGPDRTRLSGGRFRKAARAIERRAPCLIWLTD